MSTAFVNPANLARFSSFSLHDAPPFQIIESKLDIPYSEVRAIGGLSEYLLKIQCVTRNQAGITSHYNYTAI